MGRLNETYMGGLVAPGYSGGLPVAGPARLFGVAEDAARLVRTGCVWRPPTERRGWAGWAGWLGWLGWAG